ncbi:acetamidase/formamidase family protein [Bacillus sp. RG28]|uniref:Acetamidase/formamidase family protein n=1 Tax=Gottfriedia endophytica TaxID=2820819 RepID=A0A940NUS3_9BACI|nr:acetamidase/formamidase family protein [Gottfriedia endophytica]MBP0725248.1 acetamidase/formamidase family protein [Gottfriedia endophytica]
MKEYLNEIHTIKVKNSNLHGSFSNQYKPILTINSGDSVQYCTIDIGWGYSPKEGNRVHYESREKENETEWGHPMIGPIAIRDAKPGMTLEITINEIVPSWYGRNCAGGSKEWHNNKLGLSEVPKVILDWDLNSKNEIGTCHYKNKTFSVSLKPFMGVMSNAPSEPGIHSTIPPRYCGGNIDCKELVKGSVLYLPIAVENALFSVGDGHAAQGDGEVSGTAIECPMEMVDLTFVVREDMHLKMPRANTPVGWITFGLHEDLNEATIMALEGMLELIQDLYHVDKVEANALASIFVDLRITQIVNSVKGVHAVLPHGVIQS